MGCMTSSVLSALRTGQISAECRHLVDDSRIVCEPLTTEGNVTESEMKIPLETTVAKNHTQESDLLVLLC